MRLRDQQIKVRSGFTLMEMLVVVAIIVVLAGASVPLFLNYLENSKKRLAWSNAKMLLQQADVYKLDNGDYPNSLGELVQPPSGRLPYLEASALTDPWTHEYQYAYPGQHNTQGKPDIWSVGPKVNDPNGVIGTWTPSP